MMIHDIHTCHNRQKMKFAVGIFDMTAPSFHTLSRLFGDGAGKLINPVWFDIIVKVGDSICSILPFNILSSRNPRYKIMALGSQMNKLNWISLPYAALDVPITSALGKKYEEAHANKYYGYEIKKFAAHVHVTMGLFKYATPTSLNNVRIVGMIPDDQKAWWLKEYGLPPDWYKAFERIDK